MSRLYLCRHAKAGWALPGVRDFDRPLDAAGMADAELMGARMRAATTFPTSRFALTPSARARRWKVWPGQTDTGRVLFFDTLYSEDAAGYLALIRDNGDARLAAGHRPQPDDGGSGDGGLAATAKKSAAA